MNSTNYTILTVNTILDCFFTDKRDIRPLKLQKLLYFVCGIHYARHDKWLLDDSENFFVWPYGPVDVPVYYAFKDLSFHPIRNYLLPVQKHTENEIVETITQTIRLYGGYDDLHLSNITHNKGTPWERQHTKEGLWSEIDREEIKSYFMERISSDE